MDTVKNVLANYDSIVEHMVNVINVKFKKLQTVLVNNYKLKGIKVYLYDAKNDLKWAVTPNELGTVEYLYEDTCCSLELPTNKPSIIGGIFEAYTLRDFFAINHADIYDTTGEKYELIGTTRL